MPRYRAEPHEAGGSFREGSEGEGPLLESVETTFAGSGSEIFFASVYSAREVAQSHARETGGTIYVNSVSRKIVRRDFELATNAPIYYAVAESPVYTLIRRNGELFRAYWPELGD